MCIPLFPRIQEIHKTLWKVFFNDRYAHILFYSSVSPSFIVQYFASTLGLILEELQRPLEIFFPVGRAIILRWACKQIRINFVDMELFVFLVVLLMYDFDITLSMDWLSAFRV